MVGDSRVYVLRVPKLTPTALPPRVTIVPLAHINDNNPPKPVSINQVRTCTRGTAPSPASTVIKPDHDNIVLKSCYHLRPCPCPSPYNRWQGVTQPRYVAALRHFIQKEEQANFVIDPVSRQALKYRHLIHGPNGDTWVKALANDLGRLAQGVSTGMPLSYEQ